MHESESPYAFSSGNPILYADPSGADGEIQEFTSPIEDPSQNSEVKDLPNRTVINYNGRNWGKYNNSWTMQSKEVTLRESRSPVGESPHGGYREGQGVNQDPGALSFSPTYTTFNHNGMVYTEENYRNIVLDLVKTLRTGVGNPAAQGFDMESIANGGASDNFYEVLAEADRQYFGTNDFKDGIQNPYLQDLHSASNTGMDGTGLLNLWGVGSLARLGGRLLARQLGRKLAGSSPKIGVRASNLVDEVAGGEFADDALRMTEQPLGGGAGVVPTRLARIIPADISSDMLGAPGATDVFVTAADDIAGLNASQIAERLTIPNNSSGFKVIEFNTPSIGLSSPINRTNPGFVGFGKTAGGAREFVIPNQVIPKGSTIRIVK